MLKKLSLKDADDYQYAVATLKCAEMVNAWLAGREGPKWVGSEQHPIINLDDIVTERHDGTYLHTQVKRQRDDFDSTNDCKRPASTDKKDADKGRTALDKTFVALAKLSVDAGFDGTVDGKRRRFELVLPGDSLKVKKDLELRHVCDFVKTCQKEGARPDRLDQGEPRDKTRERVCDWLQTWCDFADPAHILRALCHLEIRTIGARSDVDDVARRALKPCFLDPATAVQDLRHFLTDNADPAQASTPRLIVRHLRSRLRPDYYRWVQFHHERKAGRWTVAGTTELDTDIAEPPASVVRELWSLETGNGEIRIDAAPPAQGDAGGLHHALARLALHGCSCNTRGCFAQHDAWKAAEDARRRAEVRKCGV